MSVCVSNLRNFNALNLNTWRNFSYLASQTKGAEYVDVAKYPPIYEPTKKGFIFRERLKWYETIRKKPTVEQKLLEICHNIDELKFRAYKLSTTNIRYKELSFLQHCTRTHIINDLPKMYDQIEVDHLIDRLQEPLLESIAYQKCFQREYSNMKRDPINEDSRELNRIIDGILHTMFSTLSSENKQLDDVEVVMMPRCESFWWHTDFTEKTAHQEMNVCFQFKDDPSCHIRISSPLAPIVDRDDPLATSSDMPVYDFSVKTLGKGFENRIVTMVPGFWSEDAHEFPFINVNSLQCLKEYIRVCGNRNLDELIKGSALLASFGWLIGIAANQGFTPFHEVTYPITTQTIFTNGQDWHFFVYQLNTIAFHRDVYQGKHCNLMWYSGPMTLYEKIEDGTLKGVNNNVLKLLIKFFLQRSPEKVNFELKPYCGEDTRSLEEIIRERTMLHRYYDGRPHPKRHTFEIPKWHHIYKFNKFAPPSPRVKFW